jgi:hypothetical protein
MPSFNNLRDLLRYAQKQVEESIQSDRVKDAVIEVGKRHVESDVYDVYPDPVMYERTYQLRENWTAEDIENGVRFYDPRYDEETGKNITYTIVSGRGYDYPVPPNLTQGRPFIEKTKEDLMQNKQHIEAFKEEMRERGFDVE